MRRLALLCSLAVALLAAPGPAAAVEPDEILADPQLEERAREVGKGLRCLVCQNQSIDESDADLARDLRVIVRERLVAGDSNDEVVEYVVSRYGDFVLLKPPLKPYTWALWFGPLAILIAAILAAVAFYRGRRGQPERPAPLSAAEERRLKKLLGDDSPS